MIFEELLEEVGSFGRYQKCMFTLVCTAGIVTAFCNLSIVFLAANPNHWCEVPLAKRLNLSDDVFMNLTIPMETRKGKLQYSQCKMYDLNYSTISAADVDDVMAEDRSGLPTKSCGDWTYDSSVYTSSIVTEWDLVCAADWLRTLVTSLYMAGLMVGVLLFGTLSDKIGRRKTVLLSLLVCVTCAISLAFAPSYLAFTILRCGVAIGSAGVYTTAFVLAMEIVGPRYRTTTGVVICYFWALGYILLGALAYAIRDWSNLQMALSIPLATLFLWVFIIPESPRWLYSNNRHEEADQIMRKIAKFNKKQMPDKFIVEIKVQQKAFFIDLFRKPNMRKKSLNIFFNWFVNSMVYYGLSLNTSSLSGDNHVNFLISGAIEVPAYIFTQFSLHYWGRRWPLCGTMVTGGVFLLIILAIPENLGWLVIVLVTGGKFAITASFAIIYVFSGEIYPTVVRSIGIGCSSFWARVGAMAAPFINDQLSKLHVAIPPVIFAACSIFAGLLALLLPETKNQRLPETIADAETISNKNGRENSKDEKRIENGTSDPAFSDEIQSVKPTHEDTRM